MSGLFLLAGCGGGGGAETDQTEAPLVTALRAAPVMYGEPMKIELEGDRLEPGVRVQLSGACEGEYAITLQADPTTWGTSCTPDNLGPIVIEALSAQGELLKREEVIIKAPRVEMAIGPEGSPSSFTFELEPGEKSSAERPWVDLFLHRLRKGEYDGTVFHEVRGGVLHQGGCYRLDQGIPRARPLSEPPVAVTPTLLGANSKETLAMSSDLCGPIEGPQRPGIFAIHFADNISGSLTDKDSNRFVVIGRLQAGDSAAWRALANQQPISSGSVDWLRNFPASPESVTIRRIERTR